MVVTSELHPYLLVFMVLEGANGCYQETKVNIEPRQL